MLLKDKREKEAPAASLAFPLVGSLALLYLISYPEILYYYVKCCPVSLTKVKIIFTLVFCPRFYTHTKIKEMI